MKIIGLRIYPLTLKFGYIIHESFGAVGKEEKNVLLQIFTDEGIYGLGEAITLGPFYSSESQGTVIDMITNYFFPKALLGEDPFNIDKIVYKMDKAVTGHSIAKTCVDMALHDIMGKALNVPLYRLIGGKFSDKIPLRYGIGSGSPEAMAAMAKRGIDDGYKCIKMKCGMNPNLEIECVKAVREAIGPDNDISIDINQNFTPEQAIRWIHQVEPYHILNVEQPVPKHDIRGLKRVRDNVETAIGACEAGYSIEDVMKILIADACDLIHFKVARSGGFYRSKQIVHMTRAAGVSVMGSTQLGMGVELAAMAHFAVSNMCLGHAPYTAQGYGGGLLNLYDVVDTKGITDDIVTPTPLIEKGFLTVPEGPGLGVTLNPAGLKRWQGAPAIEVGKVF
ncbi:mandelate racemase/muconate lactonizing enzyme family protein [Pelotomaculum propionicicum]|uniref:L-Ala-D/L-Glu epimerase n=1 Tax=Pelotomaculum propionicicum TaxID=258475 RepID=A0A4Y7RJ87_9FIRM|nr:mandelate racemase/muconate lactonizing enzyme family protein [Pelotomaculum propionicicum]NLI12188.1 mandelate racemase/muconate lactonizing enzyme family protein [Peptococcaceae bacterium]TEB09045.1 L-Ala-D/L-Glu epimerase [Pelotomaculum propionicicum]